MILLGGLLTFFNSKAQETFPLNGVAEPKNATYALVHATIVKDAKNTISNGMLIVKDGKILSVGPDGIGKSVFCRPVLVAPQPVSSCCSTWRSAARDRTGSP